MRGGVGWPPSHWATQDVPCLSSHFLPVPLIKGVYLMAPPIPGMKLTFADEFDSLALYSTWKPTDQWGNRYLSGNKELQLYVDPKYKGLGLNPFSVSDGVLNIKAAKA